MSSKLIEKPNFMLDLRKLDPEFNIAEDKKNDVWDNFSEKKNTKLCSVSSNKEEYYIEKIRQIEEENIKLREINEQLSRSLSMTARSTSLISTYSSIKSKNSYTSCLGSAKEQCILTSRTMSLNSNIEKNIKDAVNDIIGERSEVALSVYILGEEYFLGLDPINNTQSARVILSKTPSYWTINKIPQFWQGLTNIMSSVLQKGFLNTLSYWSFLRAPPSPKRNVKKWEGITIKYKGPLKEYKGYSLAGNDDGLFVYLQSEEDAYDNIFYCNFRKRKVISQTNDKFETRKNILNLLHANTRSYICIDTNSRNGDNIRIKLSESKRNKLMFEEIDATELLTRKLLQTAEQVSQELDQTRDADFNDNTYSRVLNRKYREIASGDNLYLEELTSRTVEPCLSVEKVLGRNNSLADELYSESLNVLRPNNFLCEKDNSIYKFCDQKVDKQVINELHIHDKNQFNISNNSRICSPRIRASNLINDKTTAIDYHEVPLTKRLNVVYIPSTTAVLVHDLVDSEEDNKNDYALECENISDAEKEYFKADK